VTVVSASGGSEDTDDAVSQAADLLGVLRLWVDSQQRTDDDVRALVDSAEATMLKNIASELAFGCGDELEAIRRLEGIAYGPSDRLSETFDVGRRAFNRAERAGSPADAAISMWRATAARASAGI
jgi:hypothetical protein